MSLKPGHWRIQHTSGKWEHDLPTEFANLDEILDWCRKEFPDYETSMRYTTYYNRINLVFYKNKDYVAFLLRWA
jgi:hypothetical protein